ncbi:zonadhesin-like isoform X2 [Parasteatoda tepidariorum]|uniref:zonadhesin-like isoform X2 n=1 Tax=Parasteatoda tepidariorum TaxID=114398 RepID=UPI001C720B72|nr:zonadhesin-like isoform X2 [Parasteatoda tepidariorum]
MQVLKWLTFIVIFSVSLSFSTESYESTYEDSSKSDSNFDYQSTTEDSIAETTFDYRWTVEDSTLESDFDYLSIFKNSVPEGSFDYEVVLKDSGLENEKFGSYIKNLLYPPDDRNCPLHEHWEYCTGLCQRNCSNWSKALICPDICVQGCLCDWGFTRGPEGNCIPVSECPPIEDEEPMKINVQYKCRRNEHFSPCEGHEECQKNCSNYDKEISCDSTCEPGCVCDEGFVRGRSGKCVPVEQCRIPSVEFAIQSKNKLSRVCRSNEHFSSCNGLPLCQKSCSNYKEHIICPLICVPGCVCDEGHVIGPSGECIPLERCPLEKKSFSVQVSEECSLSEYYDTCGTACPRSCLNYQEPFPVCTDECVPGCFCLPGYVRGADGSCILPADCSDSSYDESKLRIINLFFENANQEFSDTSSTVSEDLIFTESPSEDKCPDEPSCNRQCKVSGHRYGMCIGIKEEHCVCFE